ncbi:hypothetical protein EUGRSUZ_F01192 [Eucalyptus grandis]|uniref:Uncharacterized protein n=2 Tax=Eucalyptus grandis TaxID=71139 RepID=A0ACC3KFB1_EUCGR|nr:hypothetical protein EUGRSUZ_F01192 [Eucalyptus grandis]
MAELNEARETENDDFFPSNRWRKEKRLSTSSRFLGSKQRKETGLRSKPKTATVGFEAKDTSCARPIAPQTVIIPDKSMRNSQGFYRHLNFN